VALFFRQMNLYHRINNHLVAILTLEYSYEGKKITSKQGVVFWVTDREKFVPGTPIKIRITLKNPLIFIICNMKLVVR